MSAVASIVFSTTTAIVIASGGVWLWHARKDRRRTNDNHAWDTSMRIFFTSGSLGILPSLKPSMPHSVCNLTSFATMEDWKRSLPRSCKCTLKRLPSQLEKNKLRMEYGNTTFDKRHFAVIVDHQRRWRQQQQQQQQIQTKGNHPPWVANVLGYLQGLGRYYFGCKLMYGHRLLEYYDNENRLVAFCAVIVKGRTMRAMWFYQMTQVAKCQIYFHTVEQNVKRCLEEKTIDHLDLGPSGDANISNLKEKYGFVSTIHWNKEKHHLAQKGSHDSMGYPNPDFLCDYNGPFMYAQTS